MSNKKVRLQIEAQEAKDKFVNVYKSKADFILNFQMCKAYFKDSGISALGVVEKILKTKYNQPWQEKLIRRVLQSVRGQVNATISIPQFKYEKKSHDIIADFVIKKFGDMVVDSKTNGLYPLKFKEILES